MGDGAFSNVYKALERKTGRKVAVKVVRKYELNSTQVSAVPYCIYRLYCLTVRWPRTGKAVERCAVVVIEFPSTAPTDPPFPLEW
jgi:serine/threonine protein kinase